MRVSTLGFQTDASNQMQSLEAEITQTQTELSTGISLQNAADNPAAMAQVTTLDAQISASQQYQTNGSALNSNLQMSEQALSVATTTMQSARDLAVEANNASLTSSQRQDIATQLQSLLGQLVSTANSTDSTGNYLFSGETSTTQPFSQS
jgi:flagellar hook-associated protein 3 FlgL